MKQSKHCIYIATIALCLGLVQCHWGKPEVASKQLMQTNPRIDMRSARQEPRLLNKINAQRTILKPLGIKPSQRSKNTVTKAALNKSVALAATVFPGRSRDFWMDAVTIALSQIDLDQPTTTQEVLDTVTSLKAAGSAKNPSLEQKANTIHTADLNIFQNMQEAIYIAADSALDENRSVNLGSFVPGLDGFQIDITPKDLAKSWLFKCDPKFCQASLIKPVVLKKSLPLGLQANVDFVFSRSSDGQNALYSYDLAIDGTWKTIHLGPILAIEVSMGTDLQYTPNKQGLVIRNPRCAIEFSCNIAIAKLNARLTRAGITFDAVANLGALGEHFLKMVPQQGHLTKHISSGKLGECIMGTLKNLPFSSGDEDIYWNQILADFGNDSNKPVQ